MKVEVGKTYKHFKGHIYTVIAIAKNSETLEDMVIYQNIYDKLDIWARPYDMFIEKVDRIKYPEVEQEYRFQLVEENK